MSLETFVSVDIHQAMVAINQVANAMKPLRQPVVITVTADTDRAATAMDNLKDRVQQITKLANNSIRINVDVSNVKGQADNVIRQLRSLQKASAAIRVQASVSEALVKLQKVLDIVRELKSSSTVTINVKLDGDASQMLTDIHKRLTQLNGAGVNWSATQKEANTAGLRWSTGLGGLYSNLVMVGRGIASLVVVARSLQGVYDAVFGFSNLLAQTNAGLTTLFDGNQAKAEKLMDTLKEYAIPTPFAMADLAPLSQQAIAFGLVDKNSKTLAKDLTSLFDDVGNAAYGLGRGKEGIDRIMLAFGQMMTATRIMGQDMLQLQNVNVNAWKYLAEATGKSTAEVRKLVEQGLIPAKEGIEAIRAGMREDFWGGMTRGARTLEGSLSQLKDAFQVLTADKLGDIYESITTKMQDIVAALNTPEGEKAISDAIDKIIGALTMLGNIIVWLAGIINDKWQYIVAGLAIFASVKVATGVIATVKALRMLGGPILIATAAIIAFIAAYRNFKVVRDITEVVVGEVILLLKGLSHGFYSSLEGMTNVIRTVIGWIQKIPNVVVPLLGPGAPAVLAIKQWGDTISHAIDFRGMTDAADQSWDNLFTGWVIKGNKTLENVLTGSITSNLGIDKILSDVNKAIANYKPPEVGDKPGGIVKGSLTLGAGDADTKNLKKNLTDAAKHWDDYAKSVESAAKRQIDAIKGVADSITGMVDGLKKDLVKQGVLNDPLQPAVAQLMRDMNLRGQAMRVAQGAVGQIAYAGAQSARYNSAAQSAGGAAQASQASAAMIKQIGNSVQSGAPAASCAYTASKILQAIGVKIPTIPGAKALRDKVLSMGAAQIPFSQAQAGDLVVQSGKNYGSLKFGGIGYHTTIATGDGKVFSSSGRRTETYTPKNGNPVAYTFRDAGNAVNAAGSAMSAAQRPSVSAQSIQNILSAAGSVPVRGSNVYAVPDQWLWAGGGKAVNDSPGNKVRLWMQQWLTSKEGHDWFMAEAARTPGGKMAVAQTWRKGANAIDYAYNTANIKTATDATNKFVEQKRQEILAMREGTQWLKTNIYNSLEYKKAMDISKATLEATNAVKKSGIPLDKQQEQIAVRVKIATQAINDALRSGAFTDHIKRVADLDQQYAALHDTTIQQIAARKVLSREDAAQLTTAEKLMEIRKEVRNAQAQYAAQAVASLRKSNLDAQFALDHASDATDPVTQLRNTMALAEAQRKLIDPDFNPTWDMILERNKAIGLAIEQWDFDSAEKSLETFNALMKETELDTQKVMAAIKENQKAVADGILSEAGLFSDSQKQRLVHQGALGDINELLKPLSDQAKTFVQNYSDQIEKLLNSKDPLYETRKQLDAFGQSLNAAEAAARKNGTYDELAARFNSLRQAINGIDLEKLQAITEQNKAQNIGKGILSNILQAQIFDPGKAAMVQWIASLQSEGISDEIIQAMIPLKELEQEGLQLRAYLDTLMNGVSSSLSNAFTTLFEQGPKGFFKNLLNGLSNTLNQMATQILTSMAMKYLTQLAGNAFGGSIGGGLGGSGGVGGIITSVAGAVIPSLFGGGGGGGGGNNGVGGLGGLSFPSLQLATGMPTVPYDGMPAMLHKDEAVLTAQQASQWRREQREMARIPTSGSGGNNNGGVTVVNQYHIGQVVANNPQEFTKKIPGQRVAAGEMQRQLALTARRGARML